MTTRRPRRFGRMLARTSPFAALFARCRKHTLPPVPRPAVRVH